MSTITTIPPAMSPPARGDDRKVYRGVSWETYRDLSRAQGEGDHDRLAYDGEDLEIMTTGHLHEILKELAGSIIRAVAAGRRLPHVATGEATWDAPDARRGLQADLSYVFDPAKIAAIRAALERASTEPTDYPAPDLAVEIDISPSAVDRPAIYAALRVAEVWRIGRDRSVIIEHLQADGSYVSVGASRWLGLTTEEIRAWLTAPDALSGDAWLERLQQWAGDLGPIEG
jgi:Uma2 family endonuclease